MPGSEANLFTDFLATDEFCFEMYFVLTGKGTKLSVFVLDEENSDTTLVSRACRKLKTIIFKESGVCNE